MIVLHPKRITSFLFKLPQVERVATQHPTTCVRCKTSSNARIHLCRVCFQLRKYAPADPRRALSRMEALLSPFQMSAATTRNTFAVHFFIHPEALLTIIIRFASLALGTSFLGSTYSVIERKDRGDFLFFYSNDLIHHLREASPRQRARYTTLTAIQLDLMNPKYTAQIKLIPLIFIPACLARYYHD